MRKKSVIKQEVLSTKEKGKIVEKIVASMHELSGVKVMLNVFVPTLGNARRKREIDVLLISVIAGYPIKIAIECKNEKKAIGAPKIDAFVGKLLDIGIPVQHGIYVSASGYTSGAIDRAKKVGLRTLLLTGIDESLADSVVNAIQSIVYLLLKVTKIQVRNNVANTPNSLQMLVFYDENGKICGSISDLIWQKWLNGEIPALIGDQEIELTIPNNWSQIVDGKIEPVISASAQIRITGLVMTVSGKAKKHLLLDVVDQKIEKFQFDVNFDTSQTVYPLTVIKTEKQLDEFMKRSETINLVIGKIKLPRISIGTMYWPPSERSAKIVIGLMQAFEAGKIPDPRPINITELEGNDLSAIWEPIWSEHPVTKNHAE